MDAWGSGWMRRGLDGHLGVLDGRMESEGTNLNGRMGAWMDAWGSGWTHGGLNGRMGA